MMKKNVLLLLCICVLAGEAIYAQVGTNERFLKKTSEDLSISFNASYARAMRLAKEKKWPLSFTTGKKGSVVKLVGVDAFDNPIYYTSHSNLIAAATTRANQLWPGGSSGLALSGSSANMKNKIGIWDGGNVLGTHVELNGKVTKKDNPNNPNRTEHSHATHVAGTMVANGINSNAKGMAFGATGILAYDADDAYSEMSAEASGLLLSNHSYGFGAGWIYNDEESRWQFEGRPGENEDYKFGQYDEFAQITDDIAYNAPYYLIVKSAGNSRSSNGPAVGANYWRRDATNNYVSGTRPAGIYSNDAYDIITWDAGSKNILTVGAVQGLATGYTRKEDVIMSSFSAWGPTDDGRIKPDIVADGINLLSPTAESNNSYGYSSGTSMSAPNATGSLFLLQEYYSKLKNSATAFLRSATLKGLAIHTANEAGDAIGPDYRFGWGLLNVEKAAAVMTAAVPSSNAATSQHLLYENILTQGQPFTTTVVASGKEPLKATICWTDPKGAPVATNLLNNRTKMLVNDLDIKITSGSGASLRTYLPWTLDVNNPAAEAVRGDNTIDNVERIDVDTATVPGVTYTITVTNKGTLRGATSTAQPQAYSLLVSGGGGTTVCTSAPTSNTGARIETFTFKTINITNPAGNTSYTDNTRYIADIETGQVSPISIKVGSSDGTDQPKMLKVFIDYNSNGTFESSEQVAASSATLANTATFSGNITFPSTLPIGTVYLMRVVLQETSSAANISGCGSYGKGETQDYRVRVVNPTNDIAVTGIISPFDFDCGTDSMYATIAIRNNGSVDQTNVPVTLDIASSAGVVASLTATYPGTIPALTTHNYTFQKTFLLAAATTYTFTATANLSTDQFSGNNQVVSTITTSPKPAGPAAVANNCNNIVNLRVTNPESFNYFWYMSQTEREPFATGQQVSATTIPSNNTFYVGKESRGIMGVANKMVYQNGGYNHFNGNFMRFNNTVPVIIESARLYVGNAGKVKVTVGTIISEPGNGSYSYNVLSSTILDLYATRPNPGTGAVEGNPTGDEGAVYYLGLPVIPTGDHFIGTTLLYPDGTEIPIAVTNTGATLFRNNGIPGANTYPTSISNVAQFTGNSANLSGGVPSQYYYIFYDTKVNTGECVSDRTAVTVTSTPTPVITQQNKQLVVTNATTGIQWYENDMVIAGATSTTYTPTKSGNFKVIVTDAFSCQRTSNVIAYVFTAIDPVATAREISLKVSPNPNNGIFNLSFEVTTKADLSIEILNAAGQRVFSNFQSGFTGRYSKQIKVPALSAEVYMLRINHNKKNYIHKVIIQHK
jgi:hypothetical protein